MILQEEVAQDTGCTGSVSIIIPVFNSAAFLERAVRSALVQIGVKEIILVDDGSQDDSLALCHQLRAESRKIQVHTHPEKNNKGLAATRNRGLEFAAGDWIQFLDADDELLPGKIQAQLDLLGQAGKAIPFIVGNSIDVFSDGRRHFNRFFSDPWIGLMCSKLGNSCANLFKHAVLKEVGFFDANLRTSEEYDLMFRIMKLGYIPLYDPSFLTMIYKTNGSLSRGEQHRQTLIRNWVNLRLGIRDFLISKGRFGAKEAYHYSAYMGMFHDNFQLEFHPSINRFYYKLFLIKRDFKSVIKRRILRHG
jgi:glycosyltransferase involved in cell wall biosynthesis